MSTKHTHEHGCAVHYFARARCDCAPKRHQPSPATAVTGVCHWEHDAEASYLVDEAGCIWQTHYRDTVPDTWAGSVQRHETMGDAL